MNLESYIKQQLWEAISSTYKTENYSHAILDAMHYLSDILREKSGVDGDGHSLVGRVLGGSSPILRVNKLQTESERNAQRGLEQILRGLYLGIRNPRSHEQVEDTKEVADAIIYFINYLLSILDQSREPFTLSGFLDRVFDQHFVHSKRYVELLVEEIPLNKRFDVLIELYRRKREVDGDNLAYIVSEILQQLTEEQVDDFLTVVSEELKVTQADKDIRLTLQILPPNLWPKVGEVARLRVENRLIKSIEEGEAAYNGNTIKGSGALGTWAIRFLDDFDLKPNVRHVLLKKLEGDKWSRLYVFFFFLNALPSLYESSYQKDLCIRAICQTVQQEEIPGAPDDIPPGEPGEPYNVFEERLRKDFWSFPEDWRNSIREILKDPFYEEPGEEIPF